MSVRPTKVHDRILLRKTSKGATHKRNPAGSKILVRFVKNKIGSKVSPAQAIGFYHAYAKGLGQ